MKLEIIDLKATIDDEPILNGINLTIQSGEIHALMGPNGSGKSTLANLIMGHPRYEQTGGKILLEGEDISEMSVDERSRAGLFLAMQYPVEVPGVTVGKFLKRAAEHHSDDKMNVSAFIKNLRATMDELDLDQTFINRYLNEGFSGGEKKRMEIIQMKILKPRFALLDETDSGLDIDALKVVANGVNSLRSPEFGALIITHYQRILEYIRPDQVHIMYKGSIAMSGGPELVETLEERGYDWIKEGEAYEPAVSN